MTGPPNESSRQRDAGSRTGGAAQPAPWGWLLPLAVGVFLLVMPTVNAWLAGSWRYYHWLGVICGLASLGVFSTMRLMTRRSNAAVGDGQDAGPAAPAGGGRDPGS